LGLLYLLDADTLITGERQAYPLRRFPVFWEWLRHQGSLGHVKVPIEQFEEVIVGRGELVEWLTSRETKEALLFDEEVDPALVAQVTLQGYGNLDENGIEQVGRDPFLIAYALAELRQRTVVTFEVSAPAKRGANRKVPDVCRDFGVPCCTLYTLIDTLDFTTDWRP
jgi:hypothetical protein